MKRILSLFLLFALVAGCKKEVTGLPEETQTGAQTFGVKINDKYWIPQGFGIAPTAPLLEARIDGNNNLFINARNFASSPNESEIEIYLQNVSGPGTYHLDKTTHRAPGAVASYGYYLERKVTLKNEWITNAGHTGHVTISRLDREAHIVSGTFSFRALNRYEDPQPVTLTDGVFDIKW